MLFCDNCNDGYQIILLQVGAHSSSHRHSVLFIMFSYSTLISNQTMPRFSRLRFKAGYMKISSQPFLVHYIYIYIYMCVHIFSVN